VPLASGSVGPIGVAAVVILPDIGFPFGANTTTLGSVTASLRASRCLLPSVCLTARVALALAAAATFVSAVVGLRVPMENPYSSNCGFPRPSFPSSTFLSEKYSSRSAGRASCTAWIARSHWALALRTSENFVSIAEKFATICATVIGPVDFECRVSGQVLLHASQGILHLDLEPVSGRLALGVAIHHVNHLMSITSFRRWPTSTLARFRREMGFRTIPGAPLPRVRHFDFSTVHGQLFCLHWIKVNESGFCYASGGRKFEVVDFTRACVASASRPSAGAAAEEARKRAIVPRTCRILRCF
jgi:hypothetical protein